MDFVEQRLLQTDFTKDTYTYFTVILCRPRGDPLRKRQAFIQDLKRNINGDAELRQLLLNKDHVRQLAALPHAKGFMK